MEERTSHLNEIAKRRENKKNQVVPLDQSGSYKGIFFLIRKFT
jgi:hypothetical protein